MIALILIFCIGVVGHELYRSWEARDRAIEQTRREAENLTWGASQHAEGAFRLVDTILTGLVRRAERNDEGPDHLERMRAIMMQLAAGSDLLEDIVLLNEKGIALVDGRPVTPPISLGDRDYFTYVASHDMQRPYVGVPVRSRLTGRWIIPVASRINRKDGTFAGIMLATLEARYFLNFYATFDLGHDGAAAIWRADGVLLARQSQVESSADGDPDNKVPVRYQFPSPIKGNSDIVSPLDGLSRIMSYRRLADFPLIVALALGQHEQLAGWRADAIAHVVATTALGLLLALLGFRLVRQIQNAAVSDRYQLDQLSDHLIKARDRAEAASHAKSRFLASMSHELRTPLNGVLGYARLLRGEGALNPSQTSRVDSMLEAGQHLFEMINSILDLTEIEAGHVALRKVKTDVGRLAAACVELVRPAAEAKGLAVSILVAPGTPVDMLADPTRLRQVLLNLLGNAVKFTGQGRVALRLRRAAQASHLRIEVADTGPGIAAKDRGRLFQDFERLAVDTDNEIEGTGLGLALANHLVVMMGGRLDYEPGPTGGSVFWLELPVERAPPAPASLAMSPEPPTTEPPTTEPPTAEPLGAVDQPPPPRPLKVLVADDIAMNRDIAGAFLRAAGHDVTCVEDGAAAVTAVSNTNFDAVLMDVRMPGVDGLEATRRIRASGGASATVPIIALTAQAFKDQLEKCHDAGMDGHLLKPFEPEALISALASTVEHGHRPAS